MKSFIFLLVFFSLFTTSFPQQWENLGPHNGNGPVVRSLIQHPSNSEILYTGTNGEGVYKSYDKGDSWEKISEDLILGDISALAISNVNPDFLYVGGSGGKLYKSPDGGSSWIDISGNLPGGQIKDIELVEGYGRIYLAMTGASPERGLFVSEDESNWESVSTQFLDVEVYAVEINSDDPLIMFAAAKLGYLNGKLYRSLDGGMSWTDVLSAYLVDVKMDPNNPQKIVAASYYDVIHVSEDNGTSWYGYSYFVNVQNFNCICFNPLNSEELLAAGHNSGLGPAVYRSTNGGYSWNSSDTGISTEFVFAVLYDWQNENIAFAGSTVGFHKSTDGGGNWFTSIVGMQRITASTILIKKNNPAHWVIDTDIGIQVSENYGQDWELRFNWCTPSGYLPNSDTLYGILGEGSYSDGLYRSTNDGYNWSVVGYMMNPKALKISHTNPYRLYIIFTSSIYRSDDGGNSWVGVSGGITESPVIDLVINQNHPDTMYVITPTKVWKTNTGSSGWSVLPGPFDIYHPLYIALDPNNGEHIYIGTNEALLISDDGGQNWTNRNPPANGIYQLLLSAEYPGFVVAGYDSEGVFYSFDDGITWTEMNEGLQNLDIRSMALSPGSEFLLCGTQLDGVYKTDLSFVGINSQSVFTNVERIKVYPQPALDEITIESDTDIQQVEIFDINSNHLTTFKNVNINISDLTTGWYFLKITMKNDKKIIVKKFVKF